MAFARSVMIPAKNATQTTTASNATPQTPSSCPRSTAVPAPQGTLPQAPSRPPHRASRAARPARPALLSRPATRADHSTLTLPAQVQTVQISDANAKLGTSIGQDLKAPTLARLAKSIVRSARLLITALNALMRTLRLRTDCAGVRTGTLMRTKEKDSSAKGAQRIVGLAIVQLDAKAALRTMLTFLRTGASARMATLMPVLWSPRIDASSACLSALTALVLIPARCV